MALVTWTESMSVKVNQMDDDHMVLLDMMNELHDAMKAGKANAQLMNMVSGLKRYMRMHFDAEEALMRRHNYPGRQEQADEHQRFIDRVNEFEQRINDGQAVASAEVMRFLCNWFKQHIEGYDQQYSTHLNAHGVS